MASVIFTDSCTGFLDSITSSFTYKCTAAILALGFGWVLIVCVISVVSGWSDKMGERDSTLEKSLLVEEDCHGDLYEASKDQITVKRR